MVKSIVQQLNDIYYNEEWWQSHNETVEGITLYHQTMIDKGNLLYIERDGKLLGYVEFWLINFEQFGKLVCHEHFSAIHEDTTTGNISYVANTWIAKDYRRSWVYKSLRNLYYKCSNKCEYFVGNALRKKTQPIKVFKRSEMRRFKNNG